MNRRTTTLIIALALGATALTGCSSDKSASSSSTPAAATTTLAGGTPVVTAGVESVVPGATTPPSTGAVLTIKDFAFSALTVKSGEAFTIVNADGANHTVSADDGSFVVKVNAGTNSNLVIPAAGTYKIHCDIHKSMTGTIVVS